MIRNQLFCPGPVKLVQSVKNASIAFELCHRDMHFSNILNNINQNILSLLKIRKLNLYYPVVLTGSASAANEAIVSSVIIDNSTLIISNGEFGNRLYELAKIYCKKIFLLDFGWGNKLNINKIQQFLIKHKIKYVLMVHHETSTGMLNPIYEIGNLCKKYRNIFIVDAVSSIGAEIIDMEKSNISLLSGTTGKALGAFPGLSFVVGKKTIFNELKAKKINNKYLNLYRSYYYSKSKLQTPNTPSVPSFLAFNQALKNILRKGGVTKNNILITKKAKIIRKNLKKFGFSFLINENDMSCVLTTFMAFPNLPVNKLVNKLKTKGIIIYEGKGMLKNKIFQIANIGHITYKDISYLIKNIKKIICM